MASLQLTMYLTIVSSDVLSGVLSRLESESAHDNRAHDNRLDSRQTRCCDQTQLETPDSTWYLAFGHLRNSSGTLRDLGFKSQPTLRVWLGLTTWLCWFGRVYSSNIVGHAPVWSAESDLSLVRVWLELTLVLSKNKKWCTILYVISNNPSLIIT